MKSHAKELGGKTRIGLNHSGDDSTGFLIDRKSGSILRLRQRERWGQEEQHAGKTDNLHDENYDSQNVGGGKGRRKRFNGHNIFPSHAFFA